MNLADLPTASLPEFEIPASPLRGIIQDIGPHCRSLPLAARLQFNFTPSVKINYCDLAGTTHPPYDLRTAVILLCLCAHNNQVWYAAREAEHRDGVDDPPAPLAFELRAWHCYIMDWADTHLSLTEEDAIMRTAYRLWAEAHGTKVEPQPDDDAHAKKKPEPSPTGPSSWPTPSVEAMPAAGTTCSTSYPSAMPTPSYTHGSVPREPNASLPENPPDATPQ